VLSPPVEANTAISDAEAEAVEQLAHIRAAVAGEVTDAAGVAAVRSALLRLFDGFVLHPWRAGAHARRADREALDRTDRQPEGSRGLRREATAGARAETA